MGKSGIWVLPVFAFLIYAAVKIITITAQSLETNWALHTGSPLYYNILMNVMRVQTDGRAISTGVLMHKMVDTYYQDMLPYSHMSLQEVFDYIKSLPFRPDPETEETLMRPAYTMNGQGWGGDCDDKCIALASYCRLMGIPYRFVAVRRADHADLHHVICNVYINGEWVHADPTYSFNTLGRERERYAEYVII